MCYSSRLAREMEVHSVRGCGAKVRERHCTDHLLPKLGEPWEKILKKGGACTCYKANHSVQNAQLEKAHNANIW